MISSHARNSTRRFVVLAAVLCVGLGSGCATGIHPSSVPHCIEETEHANFGVVDAQLTVLGWSGEFLELIDRLDYLEAYCQAINEARGD